MKSYTKIEGYEAKEPGFLPKLDQDSHDKMKMSVTNTERYNSKKYILVHAEVW